MGRITRSRRIGGILAVVLAVSLVAAGCGDDDDDAGAGDTTTTAATDDGAAATLPVQVDGDGDDFNASFLAYFPSEVTARPGDTLEFSIVFTGEPHTVTFGTLVDEGAQQMATEGEALQAEPDAWQQIPPLLPEGPGDAFQSAAQPCFLASGAPPAAPEEACAEADQEQPAFDGTQSYYNSGYLEDGETFSVQLADDIEPGTYTYFCTLHRGGMVGTVEVVAAGETRPGPDEVEAAGQAQLDELVEGLRPAAQALEDGAIPDLEGIIPEGPNNLVAGSGAQAVEPGLILEFGPSEATVAAGESLTWTILGPHTISFNAPESARPLLTTDADGSVHINEQAAAPQGGAAGMPPPPEEEGPPPAEEGPPPPPVEVQGGTFDGSGFFSSGIFLSFPGSMFSYTITFTEPGTYEYLCLIHPDMEGSVTVT